MCIDMGQADRSLYRNQTRKEHKIPWTWATYKAANAMGYASIMDVPDDRVDEMKIQARKIQCEGDIQ